MDDDRLPRQSYELIAMLDEITEIPKWPDTPQSAREFDNPQRRLAIYRAGARGLIDQLVAMVEEEIREQPEEEL